MKFRLSILAISLQLSAPGATFFVDSANGNDGNAGTSSGTAWQSFSVALGRLASGDTLNCSGSWNITSTVTCSTANITIEGSGAATLNIDANSIYGELRLSGANVVLSGMRIHSSYGQHNEGNALVGITGNGSVVKNCISYGLGPSTVYDQVIYYVNAHGCTFTNLFIHDVKDFDWFRAWGSFNKWTSCTFSNNSNPNGSNNPGPHADGIQTWWTGATTWSNVVERCYFVACDNALFQLKGTPDNVVCHPGEEGYWTIRNNIFNQCPSWPVISTDNFRFYGNLVYKSYGAGGAWNCFLTVADCAVNSRYFNNVHIECGSARWGGATTDYNFWTDSSYRFWDSHEVINTESACAFVNAAAGDFRIGTNSVLRGAGLNMSADASMSTLDYYGNARPASSAWDLGPIQYGASAPAASNPNSVWSVGTLRVMQ